MLDFYENRRVSYTCAIGHGLTTSIHMHHDFEVIYMCDGSADVICDGEIYTLRKNDLFIAFPNRIHYYQNRDAATHMLIIFPPERFPDFAELFKNNKPAYPVIHNCGGRMKDALEQLVSIADNRDRTALREQCAVGYSTVMLAEMFAKMELVELGNTDTDGLHRLLKYCSNNYMKDITLEHLSHELYMNRYHISHLFNDSLGISLSEYINSLRISEAKRLLRDDSILITEVAQAVGFGTPRTFNRVFRSQCGMTPREYRRILMHN